MELDKIKDIISDIKRDLGSCQNSIEGQNYTRASYILGVLITTCVTIEEIWGKNDA